MTLLVEDGTGVDGANSYLTVAAADAYLSAHQQATQWAALGTPAKESLLIQAARAVDNIVTWKGYKRSATASMQWPRIGVEWRGPWIVAFSTVEARPGYWPENLVPQQVKDAQAEQAALLMQGDRLADPQGSGIKKLGLGQGALEVEFDLATTPGILGRFIPELLSDFAESTGGKKGMVRARRA